jgi:hypothetical protein
MPQPIDVAGPAPDDQELVGLWAMLAMSCRVAHHPVLLAHPAAPAGCWVPHPGPAAALSDTQLAALSHLQPRWPAGEDEDDEEVCDCSGEHVRVDPV